MNSQRHRLVMEILGDAIERDPAEREAWLASACAGDDLLRNEVARLLAHEKTARSFMEESPLGKVSRPGEEEGQFVGRRVGAYEIVGEIGRGGMGAVYLARRADEQFESLAAVKLIKRGMDTDDILRTFRNERQILANLNHPNVAKLLDGGTTEDGRPYFVMEYVEGENLKTYCDGKKLSVKERLKLFLDVCSAVSYAHQRLVVHRDLKPSNILVNEDGVPKLLDFGIAKVLSPDAQGAEKTATHVRALTPEYASPEQVRGEPVTTASDIYSLGVVLYELLTGQRPHRFEGRTQAEVARIISEREPERLSTAVTRAEEASKSTPEEIGALRDAKPSELRRRLRGDIDNIVLKALRKEPQRRYASVEQFAEDIERHLAGLPVRARKDTFSYRASKFVRRNKVGVAAAAAVLLTLVAGAVVSAWEAQAARVERAIAEERFNEVREMAHSVMFDYHDAITTLPGSTPVRERMVKDSLKYLDKLTAQAGDDRGLLREIASAYLRVGDVQGRPFRANLGDAKGAMESYQKSLAIRQRLTALEPDNKRLQEELGTSYERIGGLKLFLGDPRATIENVQKAIAIYEALSLAEPTNKPLRAELGRIYQWVGLALGSSAVNNLGDTKGALEYQRKSLAILEPLVSEDPANLTYRENLGAVYPYIAQLYSDGGNQAEAVGYYRKALSIAQSMAKENPTNMFLQRELAVNYSNLCGVMILAGDKAGAVESCRQALPIFEAVSSADPHDKNMRLDCAIIHRKLAEALGKANDRAGASEQFRAALRIFKELSANDSADDYRLRQEGLAYLRLSEFLSDTGDVAGAIENAQQARNILEKLVAANAKNATAAKHLALVYAQIGKCQTLLAAAPGTAPDRRADHWREARGFYQKSLDIYQGMKSKGTLTGTDAGKPDEVSGEIAKCDAALGKP